MGRGGQEGRGSLARDGAIVSYGKGDGPACFYVLDARTVVGNCAMWWCPNGQGYTCRIDEAGLYTADDVKSMRETDVPIHRDEVAKFVVQHVRLDHMRQAGLLDEFEKAKAAREKAESEREAEEKRERRRARTRGEQDI
jgi:hypothetical protein